MHRSSVGTKQQHVGKRHAANNDETTIDDDTGGNVKFLPKTLIRRQHRQRRTRATTTTTSDDDTGSDNESRTDDEDNGDDNTTTTRKTTTQRSDTKTKTKTTHKTRQRPMLRRQNADVKTIIRATVRTPKGRGAQATTRTPNEHRADKTAAERRTKTPWLKEGVTRRGVAAKLNDAIYMPSRGKASGRGPDRWRNLELYNFYRF